MPVHPCADGLTKDCFKAYPAWARQALAYKLLHILLPKQLTKDLPRGLNLPFIAPGVIIPPGVEFPPGTVIPPDVPFPPGWTPIDPPPPGVIVPPPISPVPPDSGPLPPLYVPPLEPGPVHPPYSGPGLIEYTAEFSVDGCEFLNHVGTDWPTVRNTTAAATRSLQTGAFVDFIYSGLGFGDYRISRAIFRIPLTALPAGAVMVSGFLRLYVVGGADKTSGLHRSNAALWTDKEDFLAFNAELDTHLTTALGYIAFPLSSSSLAYCKANAGGTVYFMTREYDHDILNSSPGDGDSYTSACANYGNVTPKYRPILSITYKA